MELLLISHPILISANCRQPLFNSGVEFLVTGTLEGATVSYGCPGTDFSSSVCGPDGQWSPDTTLLECPTPGSQSHNLVKS